MMAILNGWHGFGLAILTFFSIVAGSAAGTGKSYQDPASSSRHVGRMN